MGKIIRSEGVPSVPASGENYLFAFDFAPPKPSGNRNTILFIQTSRAEKAAKVFSRLRDLYPKASFTVLKNSRSSFNPAGVDDTVVYHEPFLPAGFGETEAGKQLFARDFGLIFCAVETRGTDLVTV